MSRFGVDFCRNSEKDKKDAPLSNTTACGSYGSGEYHKIICELPNLIFIEYLIGCKLKRLVFDTVRLVRDGFQFLLQKG